MNDKISTLLVDDEPPALALMERYTRQLPYLDLVGRCSSAEEASRLIDKGGIDLLFLDIQMPGMDGLALAKTLGRPEAPKFVLTTAYDQYALQGFKLNAVDYLLKPFSSDDFTRAAERARRLIDTERQAHAATQEALAATQSDDPNFFFVKSDYKLVRVDSAQVRLIEGVKDYVKLHVDNRPKPLLTLGTLRDMEVKLRGRNFVRVHRSYIVNMQKVTGVERGAVLLGAMRVPIGEGYKGELQSLLSALTV